MNEKVPVLNNSFKIIDVIKYPDITKNISTNSNSSVEKNIKVNGF